ncbi:MAG: (d)CMP kinase [Sarcina ventriculi]|uniref:Cytidylate kinase n=1 Tax=Sarcina ventriculi TaxID=1267 RepID=A0ABM9UPC6_SARVE|nr:(d)CMP kinase [Sarcina ventriculi]MBU5322057.1 (d)CMP kinase [Sarcina ventriculi]MCI5637537.1 (d)CMP kinase [Sarcina ventriculi]MDD7372672.1 (d)CMP kinase [Sarcina ventriculi]MDY7063567.1 (d)CMP kinase [Sarcina ventriculi]CUN57612.1 Cytidylate kinase [Sarcina ventriculi]
MKIAIAIDGPAGAGKSTIAKIIANKFNLMYINTGFMYRAVTLKALRNNISASNIDEICTLIQNTDIYFEGDDLILDGENVSHYLTMPNISKNVSSFASISEIRKKLVKEMQKMAEKYDVIMDGRDIGTVVLKNAKYKFFLTATPEERATRRYDELLKKGLQVSYDEILEDIKKRDYLDTNRDVDPLKKAKDAIEIDTTGLGIEDVANKISQYIERR